MIRSNTQAVNDDLDALFSDNSVIPYPDNASVSLDLARNGRLVFPVIERMDGDWSPINGFQTLASCDLDTVAAWWRAYPRARVGLLVGERAGLTVLDVDKKNGKDGFESLRQLGYDVDSMSPVMTRSPSGGRHLFFAYDSAVGDTTSAIASGLDTKGCERGAFVYAPGSFRDDRRYEPIGAPLGTVELPPYPAGLRPPRKPKADPVPPETDVTDAQRERALDDLRAAVATLAATPKGERDRAVYATARLAGGMAAHGREGARIITKADAWDLFKGACFDAFALDRAEQRHMQKTVGHGWRDGLAAPVELAFNPEDIRAELEDLPPLPAQPGTLFTSVADWEGEPIPERQWLVDGWLPSGTVTSLYGDGGLGKSLLALQLAAAVSVGGTWCGRPATRGKSLVLAAEDDRDELHRRIAAIAQAEGRRLADFRDMLVRSVADGDATLAAMDPRKGGVRSTDLYARIKAAVDAERPALLVLDTLGNLFSGSENDRAQVTQFVGLLRNLAVMHGTAVLLLAHPSKTGMASGSGDSGSTGWNGTVRSRLFFDRVLVDGQEVNRNLRRLTHMKANYGARLDPVDLVFHDGAFALAPEAVSNAEGEIQAQFLEMVDRFDGRPLSAVSGPTFAPRMFADATGGQVKASQFNAAMRALLAAGVIEVTPVRTADRKLVKGLRRVPEDGGDPFGEGA